MANRFEGMSEDEAVAKLDRTIANVVLNLRRGACLEREARSELLFLVADFSAWQREHELQASS